MVAVELIVLSPFLFLYLTIVLQINCERLSVSDGLGGGLQLPGGIPGGGGSGASGALGVRYAAPHHALLQHFSPATAAALRPGEIHKVVG